MLPRPNLNIRLVCYIMESMLPNQSHVIGRTHTRRRRTLVLVVVTAVLATVLAAGVSLARRPRVPTVRYDAYLISNPDRASCLDSVGLYPGLQTAPKYRMDPRKQQRLADANKPRGARVVIQGRRYPLAIDNAGSGHGYAQIWWNFKIVALSPHDALKAIGKPATIAYSIGKKHYVSKPTKIKDGRCKTVF